MTNNEIPNSKPYLKTLSLIPENQETPIPFIEKDLVNHPLFYRRNHFPYPKLSPHSYWLPINGVIKKPKIFSMQEIQQLPAKTMKVVLECSGDKREFFEPKVFGEQWGNGAISQGYWKGVPLKILLEQTELLDDAKEVIVVGYDYGKSPGIDGIHHFARSLPLEKALHPDTIIAYEYNQKPIPFKHGYPLRLMVPGWYAMASVKWIKQIIVTDSKFEGPFQSIEYVYYPHKDNNQDSIPVTIVNVNSTIQKPNNRQILDSGKHIIKGIAWTGLGTIQKLEVSTDNGQTWSEAEIELDRYKGYGWVSWFFEWTALKKGEYTIVSKATDSYNRTQPMSPFWNRKGYGYNAVDCIHVKVE